MSVLSDGRLIDRILAGDLRLEPFVLENIQPASIDLRLDAVLKTFKAGCILTPEKDNKDSFKELIIEKEYLLHPGEMVLGQIMEEIGIPRDCNAHIHNRSSLARLGLNVGTASYINPGYAGHLPVAIQNNGPSMVKLFPGLRICQMELSDVSPTPLRDYSQRKDTKYFGEFNSLVSKIHLDREIQDFNKSEGKDEGLANFIAKEIEKRSRNIVDSMPDDLKRELGLL